MSCQLSLAHNPVGTGFLGGALKRAGPIPIFSNTNETLTGEETFQTLRHVAGVFEPEPVTVIGFVI